jgi:hypothetical protein
MGAAREHKSIMHILSKKCGWVWATNRLFYIHSGETKHDKSDYFTLDSWLFS